MGNDHPPHELTVRGIVVPTEWDSRGKALRVAILTADEMQYDVNNNDLGRLLLRMLREEITALVRIDLDQQNRRRVTILSYEIVDNGDNDHSVEDLLNNPDMGLE